MLHGLVDHSQQTPDGILINVKVKTNQPKFRIRQDGTIEVKSLPEHGKANREILKELKKMLGCDVKILMGLTAKNKIILLAGMDTEKLNDIMKNSNGNND